MGFRRLSARLDPQPLRLLLLRVFGFGRRSSRLMDLIAARWRYIGSIGLIAAPDLAARTIEPGKLLAFVRGRLRRLFVHDRGELVRLAAMDHRRDPDGRFRTNELFCAGDVWRSAVQALMAESHLVVMDLRGFSSKNQGCAFELQTLLDVVPLNRLVLLVDSATELPFLQQVLDTRWRELRADSPNARAVAPTVRLIRADASDASIARQLTRLGATIRTPASGTLPAAV